MVPGKKVATTAALSAGAAVGGAIGFLLGETALARRAIGTTDAIPPKADGVYGDQRLDVKYRVVVIGDSSVVGYGMTERDATPTALLGHGLSHVLGAAVEMTCVGVTGAMSTDLDAQVDRALPLKPDVAVIVIGANDVTHRLRTSTSIHCLKHAISRLVDAEVEVIVGTCPDLSTVRPIMQPLRTIAGALSKRLARLQMIAVVESRGRAVSLGTLLGPVFTENAEIMFGEDRFHPSATGYANMVNVLIPSIAAALHDRDEDRRVATGRDVMPLARAADEAMAEPGTEVARVGRWAGVLKRKRHDPSEDEKEPVPAKS